MKKIDYLKINKEALDRIHNINDCLPDNIIIDTISICTLKCSMCPHKDMKRRKGVMAWPLYTRIIDEIAEKKPQARVWATFFGEGTALKDLPERILYGKNKGLSNMALNSNGTRLNKVFSQRLIEAGLDTLLVGIDAMTSETYKKIRVGGELAKVKENVLTYKALLDACGSPGQKLAVQFVQMKENERELEEFYKYWTELGIAVKVRPKVSWINKISADNLLRTEGRMPCYWLCNVMSITDAGQTTLCATDLDCMMPMGDVSSASLESVWNGPLKRIREAHLNHEWDKLPDLCKNCNDWQSGYAKY